MSINLSAYLCKSLISVPFLVFLPPFLLTFLLHVLPDRLSVCDSVCFTHTIYINIQLAVTEGQYSQYCTEIHSPWMGDIVDSCIGCRTGLPTSVAYRGRYVNPMQESTLSPQSGTMNLATVVQIWALSWQSIVHFHFSLIFFCSVFILDEQLQSPCKLSILFTRSKQPMMWAFKFPQHNVVFSENIPFVQPSQQTQAGCYPPLPLSE